MALVDKDASGALETSLSANGLVVERMDFGRFGVFDDYLLLRKLYIFKLVRYERALLLDIDGVRRRARPFGPSLSRLNS